MKNTLIFMMISMFLFSCNSRTGQQESTEAAPDGELHHHDENTGNIELNNGQKWQVNSEMKPYIEKGEELVNTFIQNNTTDYKALARKVTEQNTQLINSCTMEGKSHDELHKWLHPHLELTEALEKETDPVKAKSLVMQLQASYKTYAEYFQ
ncbi:MAG: hypothetical protein IT241_00155 [Bacteroidia bacterium]|nr:hypothetical protein [Bacteroidia bacterium]